MMDIIALNGVFEPMGKRSGSKIFKNALQNILNYKSLFLLLVFYSAYGNAAVITFEEYALHVSNSSMDKTLHDTYLYSPDNNFAGSGLSVSSQNFLDSNNIGSITWTIGNLTGQSYSNLNSVLYLDASIDRSENTYFNESAQLVGPLEVTSWEADEPGWVFGDIYDNVKAGTLDNSSAVEPGLEDDVAVAFGFYLEEFNLGDVLELTLTTSLTEASGIYQYDRDSNFGFYIDASWNVIRAVSVSEPSSLLLALIGFISLIFLRRKISVS